MEKLTLPVSAHITDQARAELRTKLERAREDFAARNAPAPSARVDPIVVLSVNSEDSLYVEALQFLLRHHGEDVEVDGNFGPQTEAAVRRFQTKKGLTVGGVVDLNIWEALWVTVGLGGDGDAVSAVQTLLNVHEFPVDVDGDFGQETRRVVLAFQKDRGLIEGGVVDEKIWRALVSVQRT